LDIVQCDLQTAWGVAMRGWVKRLVTQEVSSQWCYMLRSQQCESAI